ncbi:MAG: flagellar biosynthetic protein FliQ [Pirellulales bacterium]
MDVQQAIDLGQQTLWTVFILSAPVLLAGLGIGLVCGLFQTVTQIHDQSLSMVPKILGVGLVVFLCLPWLLDRLLLFTQELFAQAPTLLGGG